MKELHLLVCPFVALACTPDDGTLDVWIYGEEYIEQGIPAEEFVDGWSVRFEAFLVAISHVSAGSGSSPALEDADARVFELARPTLGQGVLVTSAAVAGGFYDRVSYRIAPPPSGALAGPGVNADLMSAMVAGGESLRVAGTATKDGRTVTFSWGFVAPVTYRDCRSRAHVDGGAARVELTIHGDHLFFDDLFSPSPRLAFDLIAASDANADGEVTPAELRARDISGEARYQVGSTGISDLWGFIAHQATNVGHIDGEGHCDPVMD